LWNSQLFHIKLKNQHKRIHKQTNKQTKNHHHVNNLIYHKEKEFMLFYFRRDVIVLPFELGANIINNTTTISKNWINNKSNQQYSKIKSNFSFLEMHVVLVNLFEVFVFALLHRVIVSSLKFAHVDQDRSRSMESLFNSLICKKYQNNFYL